MEWKIVPVNDVFSYVLQSGNDRFLLIRNSRGMDNVVTFVVDLEKGIVLSGNSFPEIELEER